MLLLHHCPYGVRSRKDVSRRIFDADQHGHNLLIDWPWPRQFQKKSDGKQRENGNSQAGFGFMTTPCLSVESKNGVAISDPSEEEGTAGDHSPRTTVPVTAKQGRWLGPSSHGKELQLTRQQLKIHPQK